MSNPVLNLKPGHVIAVPNMRVPDQGAMGASFAFDFSTAAALDADFSQIFSEGNFDYIQSIFVDNSLNASTFTILFPDAPPNGFQIIVQPFQQGMYPLTMPIGGSRFTVSSAGGVKVPCIFYNIPLPYLQWGPIVANATFSTPQGAFADRSGTVGAGGTSQQLMAANAVRKRFMIVNPSTAAGQGIVTAESLFVNFGAAAGVNDGVSIELTPGGSFDSGSGPVSTQQINVTAATIGHKYVAKEI